MHTTKATWVGCQAPRTRSPENAQTDYETGPDWVRWSHTQPPRALGSIRIDISGENRGLGRGEPLTLIRIQFPFGHEHRSQNSPSKSGPEFPQRSNNAYSNALSEDIEIHSVLIEFHGLLVRSPSPGSKFLSRRIRIRCISGPKCRNIAM